MVNSSVAAVLQPYSKTPQVLELTYQFALSENVEIGTYPWPVSLSLQTL